MIELMDGFCITADANQYIVGKMQQRTDEGKPRVADPQYFTTMDAAVKAAISRILRGKVQDGQVATLKAFLTEHEHLAKEVQRMLERAAA